MKIFSIISLIIGLTCAYLNINDPDPLIWIFAYLQLVILSILQLQGKLSLWYSALVSLGYISAFVTYIPILFQWFKDGMPSVVGSMKAENQYIELVREGGGLIMCIIFASVFLFHANKKVKALKN